MRQRNDALIHELMPEPYALNRAAAQAVACALAVWAMAMTLFSSALPALIAELIFGGVVFFVLAGFARLRPRPAFGTANGITLFRSALIAVLAGHAIEVPSSGDAAWWIAVALATTALALDGADGWVARRDRTASAFGARFDMEVDALAALVLAAVLWQSGRMGGWILLIGLLRYLFVLAGWAFPSMRRPLPPSQRRRVVCALQGVLLAACLVPAWPAGVAAALGALALAMTSLSFLADTIWLVRRRWEPA
jgi:phosphatidylglycerophosphate synthase